jgi:MFS family permease
MSDVNSIDTAGPGDRRRWLILGVIGLAQLMVVLDVTVMNIALPSAQRALHFTTADRQWVVTAYTLAFGSLLLLGGRLADLLGRKVTFLIGLLGFAGVSAIGGASVNFGMLITARACQGAFGALLVPSALSLLTTTFTEPKERGKAFGIYGAIAAAGGAIGLLLGGALTEYLSWRWTLYVNLIFAGAAFIGGAILLTRQSSQVKPKLDIPGVLLVSAALFCLVYGFSNAATHNWHTPSTWGFLAAGRGTARGVRDLAGPGSQPAATAADRARPQPGRRVRVHAHRLQRDVRRLPVPDLLPAADAGLLAGRHRPRHLAHRRRHRGRGQPVHDRADAEDRAEALVAAGFVIAAGAMTWFAQLGPHTAYVDGVLGPLILTGAGLGLVIAPSINTGTFGVAPRDAGVASATVTVGQQLGARSARHCSTPSSPAPSRPTSPCTSPRAG